MSSQTTSVIFSCAEQSKKLRDLLGHLFDFVVVAGVDNTKIKVHRRVLSASNDFFEAMFRSNLREAKTNEVEFKDIDGSTIRSIINFIYTGLIDINIETVQSLLEAAEFLQMKTVVTACCEFIGKQLDISNCLAIVLFADYYGHTDLQSTSYSFACKHFDEVCMNDEFYQLNVEQLHRLLSSDQLVTSSEEKVFHSVLVWIKYDEQNRNELLSKVMSDVRFPFLEPKYIIENGQSLSRYIEWYQVMSRWLQWHFSPESRSTYPPELTKPRKLLPVPSQSSFDVFHHSDEDFEESPEYEDVSVDHGDESVDHGDESVDHGDDSVDHGDESVDHGDDSVDHGDEFIDDIDEYNEPHDHIDNCDYDLNEENDEYNNEFLDGYEHESDDDEFIGNPDFYEEEFCDQFSPQEDYDCDEYSYQDYCD